MNRYPIYIPSKGRSDHLLTPQLLKRFGLDFYLVVEDNDYINYRKHFPEKNLLKMDSSDYGDVSFARNFIKTHANNNGHKYHWQLDDDVNCIFICSKGKVVSEDAGKVITLAEQFVDRYKNISAAGLSSDSFGKMANKPFNLNNLPYTCMLIRSDLPYYYDKAMVEDLDFAFQCLESKYWCTIRFNAFLFSWKGTGTRPGGYTEIDSGGGRVERQKALIRKWPKMEMKITKTYKATSLKTSHIWRKYKHGLIRK